MRRRRRLWIRDLPRLLIGGAVQFAGLFGDGPNGDPWQTELFSFGMMSATFGQSWTYELDMEPEAAPQRLATAARDGLIAADPIWAEGLWRSDSMNARCTGGRRG